MTKHSTASEIMAMQKHAMKILHNASDDVRTTLENDMAKILQEEIDKEIVWKLMVSVSGWTHVKLPYKRGINWDLITDWLIEHFGIPTPDGIYRVHSDSDCMELLFKNESDAIMTILRWK